MYKYKDYFNQNITKQQYDYLLNKIPWVASHQVRSQIWTLRLLSPSNCDLKQHPPEKKSHADAYN